MYRLLILLLRFQLFARLLFLLADAESERPLLPCTPYRACAARLKLYPAAEQPELVEHDHSSGWDASGHFPFYDEVVSTIATVDFTGTPELNVQDLCSCSSTSDSKNNTASCDWDHPDKVMQLDPFIELTFCDDIRRSAPMKCGTRNGMVRVIGRMRPSGDTLQNVSDTRAFCSCPTGNYRRDVIESWHDQFAFTYRCA